MTTTLVAADLPVEPLGLLMAVDVIPDVAATVGNVTADLPLTTSVNIEPAASTVCPQGASQSMRFLQFFRGGCEGPAGGNRASHHIWARYRSCLPSVSLFGG